MPLDPASCASSIKNAHKAAANLTETNGELSPTYGADSVVEQPPETNSFGNEFASAYHTYSLDGVVPGAEHGAEDPSIISSFINSINNVPNAADFAQVLADYWSGVLITPGVPSHGGTVVVSVVNNAPSKVGDFEGAITSSITNSDSKPYYQNFIENIQAVVETIEWTVTELMPPTSSPTPFSETLS